MPRIHNVLASIVFALSIAALGSSCRSLADLKVSVNDPADTPESAERVSFTISLSEPNPKESVSVHFATVDGTAKAGIDYVARSEMISFSVGQQTKTVEIDLYNDETSENDKTFSLQVSQARGATITKSIAVATIRDDDGTPTIVIDNPSANEANGMLTFTATLSEPTQRSVVVDYATSNGTAIAGVDYTTKVSTLTFEPLQLTKTFSIVIDNDDLDEDNETLTVTLSDPVFASFAAPDDAVATGTINDEDPTPSLLLEDVSDTESAGTFDFEVILSAPSGRSVSVNYATSNGTASAGSDYTAASGTLTFDAGEAEKVIPVTVSGNNLDEANENFSISFTNLTPEKLLMPDTIAIGDIADDDPDSTLSIANVSAGEETKALTFVVTLTNPSAETVSVNYATSATGVNPASVGSDYTSKSGIVSFASGETLKMVSIVVIDDDTTEAGETLRLTISSATNAIISTAFATGTIVDDDVMESIVAAGSSHTCALRGNGTLWCWGANFDGELGDGTFEDSSFPIQVGEDSDWIALSKGIASHVCAIKLNGTLWCWGKNLRGQIGNGGTQDQPTPVQIGSDKVWSKVASGADHTCAITQEGSLWCWGKNTYGQLGDETQTQRNEPTRVGIRSNWNKLELGYSHSCGIINNGDLSCWGLNSKHQLGDGTMTTQLFPQRLGTSAWNAIGIGGDHNCALKIDNTLWCWGYNMYGQLGDGTKIERSIPKKVGTAASWQYIDGGFRHTCSTKSDHSLWCWGSNARGQLGIMSMQSPSTPTRVGSTSDWNSVALGYEHSCATKADNTIWCWGNNEEGQIGDGTTKDRSAPTKIFFSSN